MFCVENCQLLAFPQLFDDANTTAPLFSFLLLELSSLHISWVLLIQEEKSAIDTRLEALKRQLSETKRHIINDAQLVATTATSVCFNASLLHRDFDVVIIDEISMLSMVVVIIAVLRATKLVIVAGDPMQFSPIVKTERRNVEKELPELKEWVASDLLTYRNITIFDAIQQEKGCVPLTQQGRMHPSILAPLNYLVYQGILTSRPETLNAPPIHPCSQCPLMVVDSSLSPASLIYKPSKHQARVNEHHAQVRNSIGSPDPVKPSTSFTFCRSFGATNWDSYSI